MEATLAQIVPVARDFQNGGSEGTAISPYNGARHSTSAGSTAPGGSQRRVRKHGEPMYGTDSELPASRVQRHAAEDLGGSDIGTRARIGARLVNDSKQRNGKRNSMYARLWIFLAHCQPCL